MKWYAVLSFLCFLFLASPIISGTQTVNIVCRKSYYTPNTIHLKVGEPARIILTSEDVTHGFAIDELRIAVVVDPGPPTVVNLTPDRAGTFPFYCVVRCGKDHLKMRGTLVVE